MALQHFSSLPMSSSNFTSKPIEFTGSILNNIAILKRSGTNPSVLFNASRSVKCIVHERVSEGKDIIARRSANYPVEKGSFGTIFSISAKIDTHTRSLP